MSEHRGTPRTEPTPGEPVKVEVVANHDRLKLTDRRLLIIFLLLMLFLAVAGTYVKRQLDQTATFNRAVVANCQSNRINTLKFNALITRLQAVTLGTPILTQPQKVQRIRFYQKGKERVPKCPAPPSGKAGKGDTDPPSPPATKPLRVP